MQEEGKKEGSSEFRMGWLAFGELQLHHCFWTVAKKVVFFGSTSSIPTEQHKEYESWSPVIHSRGSMGFDRILIFSETDGNWRHFYAAWRRCHSPVLDWFKHVMKTKKLLSDDSCNSLNIAVQKSPLLIASRIVASNPLTLFFPCS